MHLSAGRLGAAALLLVGCAPAAHWPAFEPVRVERAEPSRRALVLPSAYEAFVRGQLAHVEGDHGVAERHFRNALRTDPRSAYLHAWVAIAATGGGRLAEARAAVDSALGIDPCSELALCTAGQILEREGDVDGAMRSYVRAIECEPRQAEAYELLADLLERGGSTERTAAVYRDMAAATNRSAAALEALARLALDRGDTAGAAGHLEALLEAEPWRTDAMERLARLSLETGRTLEARALLAAVVTRAPRRASARRMLAAALLEAGNRAAAARQLDQLRPEEDAPSLADLAEAYVRARRYEAAATEARRALALDPSHPGARLSLGAALRGLGRPAEAAEVLATVPEDSAEADRARALGALALAEAADTSEATRILRERLARRVPSPRCRVLLAELLEEACDTDGAEATLAEGSSPEERTAFGAWLLDHGRHAEAVELLEAVARDEDAPLQTRVLLAEATLLTGAPVSRVAEVAREALARAPRAALALAVLGAALFAERRVDEALVAVDRARRLAPGSARVALRAAEVLAGAGRCEEAAAEALHGSRLRPPLALAEPLEALATGRGCEAGNISGQARETSLE